MTDITFVQTGHGKGAFMDLKQWLQFEPKYSGKGWETIGVSTQINSPTLISR